MRAKDVENLIICLLAIAVLLASMCQYMTGGLHINNITERNPVSKNQERERERERECVTEAK